MRFAHRYNWHYAPEIGPLEDGNTQRWCEWCGFRQTKYNSVAMFVRKSGGLENE